MGDDGRGGLPAEIVELDLPCGVVSVLEWREAACGSELRMPEGCGTKWWCRGSESGRKLWRRMVEYGVT